MRHWSANLTLTVNVALTSVSHRLGDLNDAGRSWHNRCFNGRRPWKAMCRLRVASFWVEGVVDDATTNKQRCKDRSTTPGVLLGCSPPFRPLLSAPISSLMPTFERTRVYCVDGLALPFLSTNSPPRKEKLCWSKWFASKSSKGKKQLVASIQNHFSCSWDVLTANLTKQRT